MAVIPVPKVNAVKPQLLKAWWPKFITLLGMRRSPVNFLHRRKAISPMLCKPLGRIKLPANDVQLSKAELPIETTLDGISIDVMLLLENALSGIASRFSGKMTVLTVLSLKQLAGIVVLSICARSTDSNADMVRMKS